jgi:hypothetical protein
MSDLVSGLKNLLGMGEEGDPESKEAQKKDVRRRFKRITQSKEAKKKWETNYETDRCHDYVRGFQRAQDDEEDAQGDKRYQINKILSALKSKIPTIFYYHPYIRIRPSFGREDAPEQTVSKRAEILQDTVNTIIRLPQTRFKQECMIALKESNWSFGVVEVGYDAEWGENPYAAKPEPLMENEEVEKELETLEEGSLEAELSKFKEIPSAETFYVKHVPARQFFISNNDKAATEQQDWVGYWEWMYVKDIQRTPSFENTENLKASAKIATGEVGYDKDLAPMSQADSPEDVPPDMIRVWKIWDQREKKRYVMAEGHDMFLKVDDYESLPIFTLRLEIMPGEWYPIPPIFQQLTEQDEYNDAREWLRLVRKGTRPRYTYDKQAFDEDELEKFETDEFGTFVGVENGNLQAIAAVQQPSFSEATIRTLAQSEAGFAEQAASSPTARLTRGAGGAPTATEVQELSASGDVRASYEQQEVADWLAGVASGLLKVAVDQATLPTWVLINSDPHSALLPQDAMDIAQTLEQIKNPMPDHVRTLSAVLHNAFKKPEQKEITPEEMEKAFGDGKWDVTADIESLSPATEAQYASRILQALNMLSDPGTGRLLSLSPELLKTMLNMMGLRNSADQKAIAIALQKRDMMDQMIAAQQQMMSGGGSAPAQKGQAPMSGGDQPNEDAGSPAPPPEPNVPPS